MASRRGRSLARHLTSWPALLAASLVVGVFVVFGMNAVQRQIKERSVESAVLSIQSINLLVVYRNVSVEDLRSVLDTTARDDMDGDLYLLQTRKQVLGLRIWNLTDGRQVYGDPDHRDSTAQLSRSELVLARRGVPVAMTAIDDYTGEQALRVLVPFDANGDGSFDAVSEVLLPRADIDGTVTLRDRWTKAATGFVLLLIGLAALAVRRRQAHQNYDATHDPLTGIGNRALLYRNARGVLAQATENRPAAVFLIDLDGFKGINDTLGHHAGDELLVAVSRQLALACRTRDIPVRLGGDEFALLLPQLRDRDEAMFTAGRVLAAMRQPVVIDGVAVQIGASVGVTFVPTHAGDLSAALRSADTAMYQAKRSGGGIVVYDPGGGQHGPQKILLLPELEKAMSEGQLDLSYQPVLGGLGAGPRVVGRPVSRVEALPRWHHPVHGDLAVAEVVPLTRSLNLWVLRTAAADCARWRAAGQDIRVMVTVDARNLVDGSFVDELLRIAGEAGIPVGVLGLQIDEHVLLGDLRSKASTVVRALAAVGVEVSLYNAGRTYLPMLGFGELPISELKIHPRLVAAAAHDPVAAEVAGSLVSVGHRLGVRCIAAGVDTPKARAVLVSLACDGVQGQAVAAPMPYRDVLAWFREDAEMRPNVIRPAS